MGNLTAQSQGGSTGTDICYHSKMQLETEKVMNSASTSKPDLVKNSYKRIPKILSGRILGCGIRKPILAEEDIDYLVRNTAITREQVTNQFKIFLKNHPDGRISKKSFQSMMQACYPGADTERLGKHIWRMYDTNQDGHIDFREFMIVLYIMSNGSPEENLKQIFRVFDINNDGRINLAEMKRIVNDLFKLIDEKDIESASQEILVKNAFSEMDEDGDGEIS